MITVFIAFINALRVTFGYSEIVKDYDSLSILGLTEGLIIIFALIIAAMYNDFKD